MKLITKKQMLLLLAWMLVFSSVLMAAPHKVTAASPSSFSWDNANVYFVMTDRFQNGDTTNDNSYERPRADAWGSNIGTFHGGDLKGLTQKLNDGYFTNLGINAIWITAPYEQIHGWTGGGNSGDFAHYAYHGYYVLDYTMVDRNMGTVSDMRTFVDTAHSQGIRVVLDVVMNHAGYNTLYDMQQYNYGNRNGLTKSWTPGAGENWHSWNNKIITTDATAWSRWWGNWVRAGYAGYTACGSDDLTQCLSYLPDYKTEVTSSMGLPALLATKWSQEATGHDSWIVPAAKSLRTNLNAAPADYITKWLSAWVEEFGIDGFRVDTAKHVDKYRWKNLKTSADAALKKWRANNPTKPGAAWNENFWMTGEVWGQGVYRNDYYDNGFDSLINFSFQNRAGDLANIDQVYTEYATKINNDPSFNVLSYISSHDTSLFDRNQLITAGSTLLMTPGGVQVYYGDESGRPFGPTGSDSTQGTRSDMNWNTTNTNILTHWQKLGQFRNKHIAVGAGVHTKLQSAPYAFSRVYAKNSIEDKVVVAFGASGASTINVATVFADGTTVKDYYTGSTAVVSGGKVTLTAHANGVMLLEQSAPATPVPVVSASPAGGTFTTDTTTVTLNVTNSVSGKYTTNGSDPSTSGTTFTNGQQITIGSGLAVGSTITLKLYAANSYGTDLKTYTFTKSAGNKLTVHFKKPSNWGAPQLYYYNTNPKVGEPTWSTAPAMVSEGNDWYAYTINGATSAYVIFKDSNGNQLPASNQPGFFRDKEGWYMNGTWYDQKPVEVNAVTLKVYVPSNTPSTSSIYLASSLNGWNPADPNYRLTKNTDGTYSITINAAAGTTFQFKFTRGSWTTVETASSGADISNRSYTTKGGAENVTLTVQRWKDL